MGLRTVFVKAMILAIFITRINSKSDDKLEQLSSPESASLCPFCPFLFYFMSSFHFSFLCFALSLQFSVYTISHLMSCCYCCLQLLSSICLRHSYNNLHALHFCSYCRFLYLFLNCSLCTCLQTGGKTRHKAN